MNDRINRVGTKTGCDVQVKTDVFFKDRDLGKIFRVVVPDGPRAVEFVKDNDLVVIGVSGRQCMGKRRTTA